MSAPTPAEPERFGKYTLLQRLGEGGMAEAFKAEVEGAKGFRRQVVVKRVLSELGSNRRALDMFIEEAKVCALLNHPNIVHVHEFGEIDGRYYLAMEYLHGQTVAWALKRFAKRSRAPPLAVAAYVAREVAAGLHYVHELTDAAGKRLGLVHRDVKPDNVMLLLTGGVKVLDFGIAKAAFIDTPFSTRTKPGLLRGTAGYHAPEQILDRRLDHRSDVFALGVVFWEMLTARRLFFAEDSNEICRMIAETDAIPPSRVRPAIPEELEVIALRALERDPDRRYASAAAMAADLENYLHNIRYESRELPQLLLELHASGQTSNPESTSEAAPERSPAPRPPPERGPAPSAPSERTPESMAAPTAVVFFSRMSARLKTRRFLVLAGAACGVGGLLWARAWKRGPDAPAPPPVVSAPPRSQEAEPGRKEEALRAPASPDTPVPGAARTEASPPDVTTAPRTTGQTRPKKRLIAGRRAGPADAPQGRAAAAATGPAREAAAATPAARGQGDKGGNKVRNAEPEDPFLRR